MKNRQISRLFWLFQIGGWGVLSLINIWGLLVIETNLNRQYIVLKGLLFFISGVLATFIIRLYLKKYLSFKKIQSKELKTILMALLLGIVIFLSLILLDIPLYNFFHYEKYKIKTISIVSTLLNTFIFISFWILIYISTKIIIRMQKERLERLELEKTLKETQLNTLKGQINPHFMFNSLNNIKGLMLEDVEKSREMITRLSEMLRYSLTKNNLDKIELSEELEMISNYVELSKIQLEDRLQFSQKIEKNTLKIKIPPMIIQMLIENAVKHGISNLSEGGKVTLKIKEKDKYLNIIVKNSGKLEISKSATKIGLNNIKKRISLLYQGRAKFSLSESNNNITAKILLPYI